MVIEHLYIRLVFIFQIREKIKAYMCRLRLFDTCEVYCYHCQNSDVSAKVPARLIIRDIFILTKRLGHGIVCKERYCRCEKKTVAVNVSSDANDTHT